MSDRCKYWDCGWCYAPDNIRTNADAQNACVNPSFCPTTNNTGGQLMPKQITLEEALKLVSFEHVTGCGWQIRDVKGDVGGAVCGNVLGDVTGSVNGVVCGDVDGGVNGNVKGDVKGYVKGDVDSNIYGNVNGLVRGDVKSDVGGNVRGNVYGNVRGDVRGDVGGNVVGKIKGQSWKFIESPKEKLQRLLDGVSEEELLKLINQLENN